MSTPANLEEVFDMAKRLNLTEQGVAMMRRNITRGRRSEEHFLKQWSARIDKELAERRPSRTPQVGRAEVYNCIREKGRGDKKTCQGKVRHRGEYRCAFRRVVWSER